MKDVRSETERERGRLKNGMFFRNDDLNGNLGGSWPALYSFRDTLSTITFSKMKIWGPRNTRIFVTSVANNLAHRDSSSIFASF